MKIWCEAVYRTLTDKTFVFIEPFFKKILKIFKRLLFVVVLLLIAVVFIYHSRDAYIPVFDTFVHVVSLCFNFILLFYTYLLKSSVKLGVPVLIWEIFKRCFSQNVFYLTFWAMTEIFATYNFFFSFGDPIGYSLATFT